MFDFEWINVDDAKPKDCELVYIIRNNGNNFSENKPYNECTCSLGLYISGIDTWYEYGMLIGSCGQMPILKNCTNVIKWSKK